ncbi:MAG: UDP-N-acetylmuramoyl-tripeptide--D-alanyl-D-alanine ligase [Lachnospiraceae bacterium]|nr:UDP-N-acetylmuramoyl-tripeptide--D-alanyl-D-alanine ligase [Lachnospiraceae bacterium]
MKGMNVQAICAACGGQLHGEAPEGEASCVVIDSRLIEEGGVFIATKGERVDGHSFIPEVFAKGALAVVCEKLPEENCGPCILVRDSFEALTRIAALYRSQLKAKIIGITGSVGKTSTKEMIAAVLREKYRVFATEKNFNNEIGVPLMILRIRDEHECAVLEMGINHFGEMTRLTKLVRPDIAVITNIGECHLEALGDRDGVLRAKSEIFSGMTEEGTAILNGDDDKLAGIKEVCGKPPVFYGVADFAELCTGAEADFAAEMPGHMRQNAAAAAAIGRLLGLGRDEIIAGLAKTGAIKGRSRIVNCDGFAMIDDCYNANPTSVRAAIDMLCEKYPEGRMAILGDMFELGKKEKELHAAVGRYAAESGVETLITVGELSKHMAEAYDGAIAPSGRKAEHFESTEELLAALPARDLRGQNVLVKASHGMHFERIVELLEAKQ